MKIVVTGANGYLGRGIVDELIARGNEVIATDFTCDRVNKRAHCMACNIFEIEDPYTFFGQPDVVLHLAWRDGFVHNSDAHFDDLPKHVAFLKKMCESGVKKIACMGTMHEIGFHEGSINENTPCWPMSMYGIAKDALRNALTTITAQNNTRFQWLRAYYIVSNTQYGNSIFSKIVAAEQEGKSEFPFTTGQNQYDFLDYPDFCHQVAAAVNQNDILGIINICSGKPEKLADRVERFISENGFSIRLKYGMFPDRPYDSKAVWGDNSQILQILSNE
ncbi:NAD(P)-dependent oxidoreductase [Bifidobacterium callimiconis]|uniref:NAD-dependent epimerase/dehydratase family protein n=1 Tax=Bifidobacterium callimiconis TaxID=2306973 RepID=UPI001BDD6A57|nr:NAD(P)-dependent oxidoreductase [Bifidobacterium callimiconis]MBT1177147.1 NAD(P)-dependent oxidoreductase [Bifidobacterium callimiconis]